MKISKSISDNKKVGTNTKKKTTKGGVKLEKLKEKKYIYNIYVYIKG